MRYTPVELRHVRIGRSLFGYSRDETKRLLDDVADSFEEVWSERGELADKLEDTEKQLADFKEREVLLANTLISAEKAAAEAKELARREAELIVSEAHHEARSITRDGTLPSASICSPRRARSRRCSARHSGSSRSRTRRSLRPTPRRQVRASIGRSARTPASSSCRPPSRWRPTAPSSLRPKSARPRTTTSRCRRRSRLPPRRPRSTVLGRQGLRLGVAFPV